MKRKNIISLSVAFAFLALSTTGILLYVKQKSHEVEITHTLFGLVFVGFAIFHILNNWSSITGYSKEKSSGKWQKEFTVAGIGFALILAGGLTEILEPIAEAGRIFAKPRPRTQEVVFEKIETNKAATTTPLSILVQTGKDAKTPIVAVWTEDAAGKHVDNLLIPEKIAVLKEENEFEIKDFNTSLLPNLAKTDAAAKANFDKPSPKGSFILNTKTTANPPFNICLEIKSMDKSEFHKVAVDSTNMGIYRLLAKDAALVSKLIVEKM